MLHVMFCYFIILYLDENKRLERLKELYPDNYNDHIIIMKTSDAALNPSQNPILHTPSDSS